MKTDSDPVTRRDLLLVLEGRCPYCEERVAGRRSVSKMLSPEAYTTLESNGINPETMHKRDCPRPRMTCEWCGGPEPLRRVSWTPGVIAAPGTSQRRAGVYSICGKCEGSNAQAQA
jgi:hypothetical protein